MDAAAVPSSPLAIFKVWDGCGTVRDRVSPFMRSFGSKPSWLEARAQAGQANSCSCPSGGGKFRGNPQSGLILLNRWSPPPLLLGALLHHPQQMV